MHLLLYTSYYTLNTLHCTPHIYTAFCKFITSHCKHPKFAWVGLQIYMGKWTLIYSSWIPATTKNIYFEIANIFSFYFVRLHACEWHKSEKGQEGEGINIFINVMPDSHATPLICKIHLFNKIAIPFEPTRTSRDRRRRRRVTWNRRRRRGLPRENRVRRRVSRDSRIRRRRPRINRRRRRRPRCKKRWRRKSRGRSRSRRGTKESRIRKIGHITSITRRKGPRDNRKKKERIERKKKRGRNLKHEKRKDRT